MQDHLIDDMVLRLRPVLKDPVRAKTILKRYWTERMALVWEVEDVHRAANEREVALTRKEAITVLQSLHNQHNPQYGIRWEDITTHIQDHGLGRKLNQREVLKFVHKDKFTIQR